MPVGPPEKPKKLSKGNLKQFMWTKLKNHTIDETLWKDLDDKKYLQRLGEEKEEMELLFAAATCNQPPFFSRFPFSRPQPPLFALLLFSRSEYANDLNTGNCSTHPNYPR